MKEYKIEVITACLVGLAIGFCIAWRHERHDLSKPANRPLQKSKHNDTNA